MSLEKPVVAEAGEVARAIEAVPPAGEPKGERRDDRAGASKSSEARLEATGKRGEGSSSPVPQSLEAWREELKRINRIARMGCTPEQVENVAHKIWTDMLKEMVR